MFEGHMLVVESKSFLQSLLLHLVAALYLYIHIHVEGCYELPEASHRS